MIIFCKISKKNEVLSPDKITVKSTRQNRVKINNKNLRYKIEHSMSKRLANKKILKIECYITKGIHLSFYLMYYTYEMDLLSKNNGTI